MKIFKYEYTLVTKNNEFNEKVTEISKKWNVDEGDNRYKNYELLITPKWSSSLNGNPVAILIEAEHIYDNLTEDTTFRYKRLWANFLKGNDVFQFEGLDLLNDKLLNINIYQEFINLENNNYINSTLSPKLNITILLSREYDGIINFTLTPIMSYGPLEHLRKTISIDLAKIASGEILLSKWNYHINIQQSVVTREYTNLETTKENITTKTSRTTNIVLTDALNKEEITETKSIESNKSSNKVEPITYLTNTYQISLTYGLDSYMFENQTVYGDTRHLKFYKASILDLHSYKKYGYNIDQILKTIVQTEIPVHTELIPLEVVGGGNITLNYKLKSSECKLQPNELYLVILDLNTRITKTNSNGTQEHIIGEHYDYRYMYTNTIFNLLSDYVDDFNSEFLSITPHIELTFPVDKVAHKYLNLSNETLTQKDIINDLKWLDETSCVNEKVSFKYEMKIIDKPSDLTLSYNDNGFNLNYNPNLTELIKNKAFNLDYTYPTETNIQNSVVQTDCNFTDTFKELSTNFTQRTLSKTYQFNITRNVEQNELNVCAIKTNLLNIYNKVNDNLLFLSELKGLNNTMMCEPDSIFSVGMHNDGEDYEEEWYGEASVISEGYASDISKYYDDSEEYNSQNLLPLEYYNENSSDSKYYYLRKTQGATKQFGLEKDDVSETFYTYMDSEESKELGSSLTHRSIAPLLFVTSGYAKEDANKEFACVWALLGEYKAPSQPANGNAPLTEDELDELDDEADEKHNFNDEHPYWFIDWSAVNAFKLTQFLGTLMLKSSSKYGTSKYVTTNNYFMLVSNKAGNPITAVYLEDLIRQAKQYSHLTNLTVNKPIHTTYQKYKGTHIPPEPCIVKTPNIELTLLVGKNNSVSVYCKSYSMGDLIATQLAQFAIVNEYTIPILMNITNYVISDEHKTQINELGSDTITVSRKYTLTLDNSVEKDVNKHLLFNNMSLSTLNDILPSNNLRISSFKNTDPLTHSESIVFNPMSGLIPNFNEASYMVEVTPYGNMTFSNKASVADTKTLFYWDDSEKIYKVYTPTAQAELYKYGKFSKYSYVPDSLDTFYLSNNKYNYTILDKPNEILESFIKFHPMTAEKEINPKHRVTTDLKYDPNIGLYNAKLNVTGDSDIKFHFKKEPKSSESNSNTQYSHDHIAYRSITKLATPPILKEENKVVITYVDPSLRI